MPLRKRDRAKLLLIENSWRLSKAINVTLRDTSATGEVWLPISGRLGLNLAGPPDADLLEPLRRILALRSGPIVDVGANVGMLLRCLLEIDREVPYLAFEPDLSCCKYLDSFIRANQLQHHAVFPVGLADEQKVVELQFGEEGDVSATIMRGFRPAGMYANRKRILVQPGDWLLSQMVAPTDRIRLIKIDAEGAEILVLKGLRKALDQHRPCLILEVSPYQHFLDNTVDVAYFGSCSPEERVRIAEWRMALVRDLDAFLESLGYAALKILRDGSLTRVASVDPGQQTSFAELNYLALPTEELRDTIQGLTAASTTTHAP